MRENDFNSPFTFWGIKGEEGLDLSIIPGPCFENEICHPWGGKEEWVRKRFVHLRTTKYPDDWGLSIGVASLGVKLPHRGLLPPREEFVWSSDGHW